MGDVRHALDVQEFNRSFLPGRQAQSPQEPARACSSGTPPTGQAARSIRSTAPNESTIASRPSIHIISSRSVSTATTSTSNHMPGAPTSSSRTSTPSRRTRPSSRSGARPATQTYGDCGCDGRLEDVSERLDLFARYQHWTGGAPKELQGVPQAFGEEAY